MRTLIVGGTGCVGRALSRALVESGASALRTLSRRAPREAQQVDCEHMLGDVTDPSVASRACAGVDVAYYLMHALDQRDQARVEARAAQVFSRAAARAQVRRIVYLGAIDPDVSRPSELKLARLGPAEASQPGLSGGAPSIHIQSRLNTGRILQQSGIPTVELRASILVASGSAVFDLLSSLTERFPVVIVPHGAEHLCQPIALSDTLPWLIAAAHEKSFLGPPIEIGGRDVVTYASLMRTYARVRGLQRRFWSMPVATPRLSGAWIGAFSRVSARAGATLVRGLDHDSVVRSSRSAELGRSLGFAEPLSLERALHSAIYGASRHETPCVALELAAQSRGSQPSGDSAC